MFDAIHRCVCVNEKVTKYAQRTAAELRRSFKVIAHFGGIYLCVDMNLSMHIISPIAIYMIHLFVCLHFFSCKMNTNNPCAISFILFGWLWQRINNDRKKNVFVDFYPLESNFCNVSFATHLLWSLKGEQHHARSVINLGYLLCSICSNSVFAFSTGRHWECALSLALHL